jgi:hypothetical protein
MKASRDNAHAGIAAAGLLPFWKVFGFQLSKDTKDMTHATRNPFRQWALWIDGRLGIGACVNHVEGFHGQVNKAMKDGLNFPRRI